MTATKRTPRPLPPLEYLRESFDYCAESGALTWRHSGRPATSIAGKGYAYIRAGDLRGFRAHRIAYALAFGVDPGAMTVDHINGRRLDNRAENLRLATVAQNNANRNGPTRRNLTSRARGVSRTPAGKWRAQVNHAGRAHYAGTFATLADAAAAAAALRLRLFGEFAGKGTRSEGER